MAGEAIVDYEWNETHLIVNVTSLQGIGSAQIKLNISSDLALGSAALSGFMAGAVHMQSGTEHRWFQLSANGNNNGVLIIPMTCSSAAGSYEVILIDVNIKDSDGTSIIIDRTMPLYQTINCSGNLADLTVTNITHAPQSPISGEKVTITATIKNLGNINLDLDKVNVSINISNKDFNSWQIANLKNDEEKNVKFSWIAEKGSCYITITVDPNNGIDESNKNNNILKTLIEVASDVSEKTVSPLPKELQTEKSLEVSIPQQETENGTVNRKLQDESENITITTPGKSSNITPLTALIEEPSVQSNTSAPQDVKQKAKPQENTNQNQWLWLIIFLILIMVLIIIKKFI